MVISWDLELFIADFHDSVQLGVYNSNVTNWFMVRTYHELVIGANFLTNL